MKALTVLRSYLEVRRRRFASRAALLEWQDRQVQAHLRRVVARSPFYARRFADLPLGEWRSFPVLEKAGMMAHFDTLNTVGLRREEALTAALEAERTRDFTAQPRGLTVGLSSGTSGHRGLFVVSDAERLRWAGAVLARCLPDPLWAAQRVAFFLRADSQLYGSVASRRIRFAYFDLMQPLASQRARLEALDPTVLVGPPSLLRAVADAQAARYLRIRPRRVLSVAEVLEDFDRARLEEAFGVRVGQVYQATEGFLGFTCAHGTLHLNEDLVAVQRDELGQGRFHPILTDFHRLAQPIVRYRLNDVLVERSRPCPCGSPLLALDAVLGRADDLLDLPGRMGGRVTVYPDFARRALLAVSGPLEEYRIRQTGPDELEVALQPLRAALEAEVTHELRLVLGELGAALPRLRFVPYAPPPPGRKLRRVERAWSPEASCSSGR
ncbi:putative adenylate-forming enzyme [Deinobacterium chartae]|uniref:Putative adenylate-forming enzyme n=1 Tax=Deinobacterium chartae TaxID=521158 RepID=A0A841HZ51_9DEIO|nr:F390 synthetase-related protein [Deinobacterium chartae]MBB6098677.1 putative adenylate-forming enzyme [Deinobacterium chartae]